MAATTSFFPSLRKALFGRPPVSEQEKIARRRGAVSQLCMDQLSALFGGFLPVEMVDFRAESGTNSRRRTYTPAVTFWGFLGQVLSPGSSCRRAVSNIQALLASQGLPTPSGETKAYCAARRRLPVRMLYSINAFIAGRLCAPGGREVVIDGSGISMPDTPENQAKYPQHAQKPGCGFPEMKIVGLFCLKTGAWLATAKGAFRVHETKLARLLFRHLKAGDTLIADRGFCSYWAAAMLVAKGVDFVFRIHQKRDVDFRRGVRLGKCDHCVSWVRPAKPKWMPRRVYDRMPERLPVRETRLAVAQGKGFRTKTIIVVSSFLNGDDEKTAAELGDYYARRWDVELYFDDIKTSQAMDVLRTKSPALVCRELLMHMIAYNLIRSVIAVASAEATDPRRAVRRSSFKGTADRVASWSWAVWSAPSRKKAQEVMAALHAEVSEDTVPERPGRREPRAVKRRPKNYQLLTKPRRQMRETPHRSSYRRLA